MSYTKTTWVNNSAPAINADNLNHIEEGIETNDIAIGVNTTNINNNATAITNLTPVELYDNESGTTSTVNLSETSANFTYLEIFYRQNEYTPIYSSVKVYKPNGKQVSLVSIQSSNGGAGIVSAYVSISGTSITKQDYNIFWTNGGNSHTDKIYITRVIGYR